MKTPRPSSLRPTRGAEPPVRNMTPKTCGLLPVATVADRLACSPATVYRLISAGKLAYIRTGVKKGYMIPEDALAAFLERRAKEAEEDAERR